jgi:LPS-assembly protein
MGLVSLGLLPGQVAAFQCPAPAFVYEPGSAVITDSDEPVLAQADEVISEDGVVSMLGNTSITYQNRILNAEDAQYNPETAEVTIDGELSFTGEGIRMQSNSAVFDMDDNLFSAKDSEYEFDVNGKRATGSAKNMERDVEGNFTLDGATYSSCPPGDKSWYIRAKSLKLYPDEGIGTAKNLALIFKGVPLLAIPTFSFPISDKRKTGFLAPIIARGDNTGIELHVPWYWNIRHNLDATFTPRFTSKRGTQLQTEVRYLNQTGNWILDHEYLNDTRGDDETRTFTQLRHNGTFGNYVRSEISASRVSDGDYFTDLGDSLQLASITHLDRRADLRYERGSISALARLQSYQTVDESIPADARPYQRLPQLTARWESPKDDFGIRASADAELVYFDRANSVNGSRLDIQPKVQLPISGNAWFFTPSASYRFSTYSLDNAAEGQSSRQSRNLTTFSLDTGLFFDRKVDEKGSVQTLEPRLFYLRVPYRNQSQIPLFDSSELDFSISQLFRENRFSGADRVADADQLSAALTSRFIDGENGREVFRASIGQITYFEDRRVSLAGTDVQTRDFSDVVGEVSAELPNNWYARGQMQWNPDNQSTVRGSVLLSYRPTNNRILNFAHRSVNTGSSAETEQLDFSMLWPIGNSWRVASRWNYSLDSDVSLESLLGVEYNSCCWAFRFAARRFIADDGESHDTNLYFQLVLKGLAPVGQNYGGLLENAILGYRDDYKR